MQARKGGGVIALIYSELGTESVWSETRSGRFTLGKDGVPLLQEVWWASGPDWKNQKISLPGVRFPDRPASEKKNINLSKPTCYVMHQKFNIQQLYALPTLYLCVLHLSENKLVPLTA